VTSRLFRRWLRNDLEPGVQPSAGGGATSELKAALADTPVDSSAAGTGAPAFGSQWCGHWARNHVEELSDPAERSSFQRNVEGLTGGTTGVVITGQQPGFLGGPLYTLFKIATTIVLARRCREQGRPTVALFWSGDADDDLAEALAAMAWDPAAGRLFHSEGRQGRSAPGRRRVPLGDLVVGDYNGEAARWLESRAAAHPGDPLVADLAELYQTAVNGRWSWSQLQRRVLLRTFSGSGLAIVSGNDSALHAAAGPLYRRILTERRELTELARVRGTELVDQGYHQQVAERSLNRSLFRLQDGQRVPVAEGEQGVDPSLLRPGVMLRSPVQDYLFRPAAVIVGPGELAYLRQLDPVMASLDVPRSPLVPRLFGWLLPDGFDADLLDRVAAEKSMPDERLDELARGAGENATADVQRILEQELGLSTDRAGSLAEARGLRWQKGVAALLRGQARQQILASRVQDPPWIFPAGKRQERGLASLAAVALWGRELIDMLLAAADAHLEYGQNGDWREFRMEVSDPS